jgi:hypothetical protein
MLMLSEAGHKEVAAAAARKEKELSQLAAQKLKDGASTDTDAPSRDNFGLSKPETVDESGVEGADYVVRIVRGKTHYRLAGSPDMTFRELKAKLEPLAQAPHASFRPLQTYHTPPKES